MQSLNSVVLFYFIFVCSLYVLGICVVLIDGGVNDKQGLMLVQLNTF